MRTIFLILLILLSLSFSTNAQYKYAWEHKFGENGRDEARSVIQTSDKGIVMAGFTMRKSSRFAWIIKLKKDGYPDWGRTYQRSTNDAAESICETADKGMVVAGRTWQANNKYFDIWVFKIDSLGNVLWEKTFGSEFNDEAFSVKETKDKNLIVAGYCTVEDYGEDYWIAKLDSEGNLLWEKKFGNSKDDRIVSIIETSDNCFVGTGVKSRGKNNRAYWVVKLSNDGELLWNQDFKEEDSEQEGGAAVVESADGNIVTTGYVKPLSRPTYDMVAMKLDREGNKIWRKVFSGENWGEATSICNTYDKQTLLTGFAYSANGTRSNFWMVKLDSLGNQKWNMIFKRRSLDYANSVIETYDKGIVVAGTTYAENAGSWDFAILKLKNIYFPDTLQISFYKPDLDVVSTVKDTFLIQTCLQSQTPLNVLELSINDSLYEKNALLDSKFPRNDSCDVPFRRWIPLKVGKNKVKVAAKNENESSSSREKYIYFIPYLRTDW